MQSKCCHPSRQCLRRKHVAARQVILKDVCGQAVLSPGVQAAGAKDADAPPGQVPPACSAAKRVASHLSSFQSCQARPLLHLCKRAPVCSFC